MRSNPRIYTSGFLLLAPVLLFAVDLRDCNRPLGLESGRVKESQITASSAFDPLSTGPQHARIRTETGSGAWCPLHQINGTTHEWLQVEFPSDSLVTAIETQGRWDGGRGLEFAKSIMIEYWRESLGHWSRYRDVDGNEILDANSDPNSPVLQRLDGAFVAKLVRVIPVSEQTRTVCLRLEIYGCAYREPLRSYSMPQGSMVDALDLRDMTYDGVEEADGRLRNGLGRLFDGTLGSVDFDVRLTGWVGWNRGELSRRAQNQKPTVIIDFYFATRQNISAVAFYVVNQPKRRAHVFETARLQFGIDDGTAKPEFSSRGLRVDEDLDRTFESARWIRIPVPNRLCNVLRVELSLSAESDWLLISEVRFESVDSSTSVFYAHDELETDPLVNGNTLTYIAISSEGENDGQTIRWMIIGIVAALTFGCISLCVLLHLLFSSGRREKQKRLQASPPRAVKMQMESGNRYVTPLCQSRYDLSLMERGSSTSDDGEYAEPECDSLAEPLIKICTPRTHASRNTVERKTGVDQPLSSFERFADLSQRTSEDVPTAEFDSNAMQTIDVLGRGEFGELRLVQLAKNNQHQLLVRVSTADVRSIRGFHREQRVICQFAHQNVCRYLGLMHDLNDRLALVYESPACGPLPLFFRSYPPLSADQLLDVGTQVAAGCAYLESLEFVHRDIAARSILVDAEGIVKICDFAASDARFAADYVRVEDGRTLALRWSSPEIVKSNSFSSRSDSWALAVTLWQIFGGCSSRPFAELNDSVLFALLQSSSSFPRLPCPVHCPTDLFDSVIVPCLNIDPASRPTLAEIHRRLQTALCHLTSTCH